MDLECRRKAATAGLAWLALMAVPATGETVSMAVAAAFAMPDSDDIPSFAWGAAVCFGMCVAASWSSGVFRHAPVMLLTSLSLASLSLQGVRPWKTPRRGQGRGGGPEGGSGGGGGRGPGRPDDRGPDGGGARPARALPARRKGKEPPTPKREEGRKSLPEDRPARMLPPPGPDRWARVEDIIDRYYGRNRG